MPEQDPWVSVDAVAKHLGIARDTVYRWIDAKGLPAHRAGRLWKFKLSDIDEWVRTGAANEGRAVTERQRRARKHRRADG